MNKKVLVVDDNKLDLHLFEELLRPHGVETMGVRDSRLAIKTMRSFNPDMIVMDMRMPHIDGIELLSSMRADPDLSAVPVMAVTAYTAQEDEARVRGVGADAYMAKPITVQSFLTMVEGLIGGLVPLRLQN